MDVYLIFTFIAIAFLFSFSFHKLNVYIIYYRSEKEEAIPEKTQKGVQQG